MLNREVEMIVDEVIEELAKKSRHYFITIIYNIKC
jgi:hypothetical protein